MELILLLAIPVGWILAFPLGNSIERLFQSAYKSTKRGPLDIIAEVLNHYDMTANILTYFRLCGSILVLIMNLISLAFFGSFLDPGFLAVSAVLLAITDPFDGKLARLHGPTEEGKLLDSIADKIFMITYSMVFLSISWTGLILSLVYGGYVTSAIGLNYFRSKLELEELADRFEANSFGKIKTCLQFPALGLLYASATGFLEQTLIFQAAPVVLLEISLFFDAKSQITKAKNLFVDWNSDR